MTSESQMVNLGYEEADRRAFIGALAANKMAYCGKCKSIFPVTHHHECTNEKSLISPKSSKHC